MPCFFLSRLIVACNGDSAGSCQGDGQVGHRAIQERPNDIAIFSPPHDTKFLADFTCLLSSYARNHYVHNLIGHDLQLMNSLPLITNDCDGKQLFMVYTIASNT